MTHVEVLREMAQTATQKLSWIRADGANLEVPAYKKLKAEADALTAAIAALEAEQNFPQFSADNWFENWFNRYPADVRKKLSMHDLGRMYDAILEVEFDPSATMDSLLDSSAADQQEQTP